MAHIIDILIEKVDVKDKISKLDLNAKNEQTIIAYNNFYNTILGEPDSESCENLQTFILYHPASKTNSQAFIDMNFFANNLLKMNKTVIFLKFISDKNCDYPEFSVPEKTDANVLAPDFQGLKTKVINFDKQDEDLALYTRFPDVIIPPTWYILEGENWRIGGGNNNWFKFVKKIEILYKQQPKLVGAIFDCQKKPKTVLKELCKCRKRGMFLKLDYAFSGDEVTYKNKALNEGYVSSDDEHGHKITYRAGTEILEHDNGKNGIWATAALHSQSSFQ